MRRLHGLMLLAGALVVALCLTGCGGGGNAGAGGTQTPTLSPQEKGRKFAQCMRANGVEMEDPQIDGEGRSRIRIGGGSGRPAAGDKKVEAAMSKCRHLMPGGDKPRTVSPEDAAKIRQFAKCMREHGIDMPDPVGGRIEIRSRKGAPDRDKIEKAQRECERYMPERPGAGG